MIWNHTLDQTHLSDAVLSSYTDGLAATPATRAHLEHCSQCRQAVADFAALGEAARAMHEDPPALDVLREAVRARRAAGERRALPVPRAARAGRRGMQLAAALLVGAILGGLTVNDYLQRSARRVAALQMTGAGCGAVADDDQQLIGADASVPRALLRAGIAAMMPVDAGCQADTAVAPPVLSFDVARLRPMRLTYQHRSTMDSAPVNALPPVTTEIAISRAARGADSAWVVGTVTGNTNGRVVTDSLYFGARDLHPLRFVVSHGVPPHGYVIDLHGDRGTLHQDRWRAAYGDPWTSRDLAVSMRADAKLPFGPPTLELALQTVPLASGWSGSVRLFPCMLCILDWAGRRGPAAALHPTSLRVLGERRVTVPGGSFDTWAVAVSGAEWGRGRTVVWVAKDTRAIVRTVSAWVDGDGDRWVDETVLTASSFDR
jgi:hypothetical protein